MRRSLAIGATALAAVAAAAVAPPTPAAQAASAGGGIWVSLSRIRELPMSGSTWTSLKSAADGSLGTPSIADQDSDHDVRTLAVALVYARTGDAAYRAKAANAIVSAIGTEAGGRTLALGRNLSSYVVAAGLIDLGAYNPAMDQQFRSWLSAVRRKTMSDGSTLVQTNERRPNNWGTNAGASRAAADLYLGDTTDLARAVQVFRGWLGDRSAYAGFSWGDLSWQSDPAHPVGINPKGATIQGHDVDGVLPDDERRSGGFIWPAPKENYTWGALGPAFEEAELLYQAGYTDVYQWSDSALYRAIRWLNTTDQFPAQGDDGWIPWVANYAYGSSFGAPSSTMGKPMAWTSWTHAGSRGSVPSLTSTPSTPTTSTSTSTTSTSSSTTTGSTSTTSSTGTSTGSTSTTTSSSTTSAGTAGLTFSATADALVNAANPTKNYGALTYTRVKANLYRTYITFDVAGLNGPATSAKLRLYATNRSDDGGSLYVVGTAWSESTITWANAPAVSGSPIARVAAPATGQWIEVDLGSLITGNGTYSIVLASSSTNSAYYASKEAGAAPTLVVTG